MPNAVVMPKLGQTVEEATLVKWHKKEGDVVRKGDVLFELETDKAILEAESFFGGTLLKILVSDGGTVPVSSVVAYIGKPGDTIPPIPNPQCNQSPMQPIPSPQSRTPHPASRIPNAQCNQSPPPMHHAPSTTHHAPSTTHQPPSTKHQAPSTNRLRISPRARALAKECCIDPAPIAGTGPDGRIVEEDVHAYLESHGYDRLRISPSARALAAKERVDILSLKGTGTAGKIMIADVRRAIAERPKPMSRMRRVIARRLTESFTTTPHFFVTVSVDMTDLAALRRELKKSGKPYSVTDFILYAVTRTLQESPVVNSVAEGNTVRWRASVDLGMAVQIREGLVVPVIRNADSLTLAALHEAAASLAVRARKGKLLPEEITGSTFTVSNMGMLGVEHFTAIINPGEGAILAVASTIDTAVPRNGAIEVRSLMKITLASDHRIIDGATAAAFVNGVKQKLEDVELWRSLT